VETVRNGVDGRGEVLCPISQKYPRVLPALVFAFLAGLMTGTATADELSLLVNGRAVHIGKPAGSKLNERNWGLGLQYDWNLEHTNWIPFAAVSGFSDSNRNASYYAGGGALYRVRFNGMHVDAGAVGFVMTRKDYNDDKPFIGVLPALSVGIRNFSLNFTYVPKADPKAVPLWFFQVKINLKSLY
jgi:hypothetical protein